MDRPIHSDTPFGPPEAGPDPAALFERWFADARAADARNAGTAALATAGSNARPSLRMVLLKQHSPAGFVFYTNYISRKARELADNPHAALTFWWHSLERQVRIEGTVHKISAAESDAYFATRPRDSQLSAWASPQSRPIDKPLCLDAVRERFGSGPVPRPETWGGLRLRPARYEFWQGRENRLHDRLCYTRLNRRAWDLVRLAP